MVIRTVSQPLLYTQNTPICRAIAHSCEESHILRDYRRGQPTAANAWTSTLPTSWIAGRLKGNKE